MYIDHHSILCCVMTILGIIVGLLGTLCIQKCCILYCIYILHTGDIINKTNMVVCCSELSCFLVVYLAGQSMFLHLRCLSSGRVLGSHSVSSTTPTSGSKQRTGWCCSPAQRQKVTCYQNPAGINFSNTNTPNNPVDWVKIAVYQAHRWCCSQSRLHISKCTLVPEFRSPAGDFS